MTQNRPTISIVIPAYNEQNHIAGCLEAIARQKLMPDEVIVVDNKSTDDTARIARRFPFVKVVQENQAGVVFARDLGYNTAQGDIIGRIDADTLIPEDWTLKLRDLFSYSSIQAVTGSLHFYDIGWSKIVDSVDAYWRAWMAERMSKSGDIFLLGANMAIRRSAWQRVSSQVCHKSGFHEDLDLALHLSQANLKVVFDDSLKANVSARRIDGSWWDLASYAMVNPRTYISHHARDHIYMYPIISIALICFWPLKGLFRAYDIRTKKLSFKQLLLSQSATRINPTQF